METVLLPAGDAGLAEAARILRQGGLVSFPTETVYGLGGLARDPKAIRAIFTAKGRPPTDPLILHLPEPDLTRAVTEGWLSSPVPAAAVILSKAFWPGPLTLVLPKGNQVNPEITAGLPTVAVRCPSHSVARQLLRLVGEPLAAPSANRFGRISPTDAMAVRQELDGRIPLILDGGPCPVGVESTVVRVTADGVEVLRPGGISTEEISKSLRTPVASRGATVKPESSQPSPGMLASHYAPRTPLYLCKEPIRNFLPGCFHLVFRQTQTNNPPLTLGLAPDGRLETAARELYRNLRLADESGAEKILVEPVPEGSWAEAIRDRLTRASTGTAIWKNQGWEITPKSGA